MAEDLGLNSVAHLNSVVQPRDFRNTLPFEDESLIVGRWITLRCCNRCEEFPQLGQLPKLRETKKVGMDNLKVIGSDIYGGLYSGSSDLSDSGAA